MFQQCFCPVCACAHCLHMRRNKQECYQAIRDHHESLGCPLLKYANVPEDKIEQIAAEVMSTGVAASLELPESADTPAAVPTASKKAPPKAPAKALGKVPPETPSKAGL